MPLIGGEAHVAVGENADQLAGAAIATPFDNRNSRDAMFVHQRQGVRQRRIGMDSHRIDHHAGLELFHLPDLCRLYVRLEIAVNDADAAGLRHGDRHVGFGHRVHGRSDDRDIQ